MGAITKVQWTDRTFNWWEGCTRISPGCANCFAAELNRRFAGGRNWGPGAPRHRHGESYAAQLQRWNRYAGRTGQKRRVFVASMSDWLDKEVPPAWRTELCAMIDGAEQLRFQMLTKRIGNLLTLAPRAWLERWPTHVGVMITLVDQPEVDRDLEKLLRLKRELNLPWVGLSCEPLLGPQDLGAAIHDVDLVIAGGEAGAGGIRAMHPSWPRGLRDQCHRAGTPFYFKQWGAYRPAREAGEATLLVAANPEQPTIRLRGDRRLVHPFHLDGSELCAMAPMRKRHKLAGLDLLDGQVWDQMPTQLRSVAA